MTEKKYTAVMNVTHSETNRQFKPGETLEGFTAEQLKQLAGIGAAQYAGNTKAQADQG